MAKWVIRRDRVEQVLRVDEKGLGYVVDVGGEGEEEDVDLEFELGLRQSEVLEREEILLTASGWRRWTNPSRRKSPRAMWGMRICCMLGSRSPR